MNLNLLVSIIIYALMAFLLDVDSTILSIYQNIRRTLH